MAGITSCGALQSSRQPNKVSNQRRAVDIVTSITILRSASIGPYRASGLNFDVSSGNYEVVLLLMKYSPTQAVPSESEYMSKEVFKLLA